MGVKVVQLTSKSHHESILASLSELRLQGQLSDVTVRVDYQGDVHEFRAHQVMLAASSGYFRKILLSRDAARDKLSLSNMPSADFSKFLEFVYTGKVEVARDKIVDVQAAAQFLDCEALSEVCGEAMSAGLLHEHAKKTSDLEMVGGTHAAEEAQGDGGKEAAKNVCLKRLLSPQERFMVRDDRRKAKKIKLMLRGRKVLHRRWNTKAEECKKSYTLGNDDAGEIKDGDEAEAGMEKQREKTEKSSAAHPDSEPDDCRHEDVHSNDPDEPLSLSLGEEEEEDNRESKDSLKRTSKAQFQCNKCQRTFHYERSYLKHISTYHGVKAEVIYRCETCQQTFANRSNLKIHEKHVHSSERLFSCDACAKTFKRKKDVIRHQRQVHERNNRRHVCPECGKSLSSKTALVLHERTHTGAKPFECADCGARFTQNSALKMHQRTHTGEKPFACDECDARFTQKHMLAYHKRSHTGEKPFMCEACGKSFASKEYLRHHSNIHTGSKPYKCEQCGRGFAQRNSLHQHLKIHTGERPYSCKDCEKHFTQLNALQRHQRIHTGEKPYMCGLCNRTFTDKSTLRRHTMIHDSDAPWKTYLVVLEGNVEDKKTKPLTKGKTDGGEKNNIARRSDGADGRPGDKTHADAIMVPAEPVALPSEWAGHGAIAVVSHSALGGITVIHTEVPAGAQIQPIVTTDGTGANVISLDSSAIPVPFSMAHQIPLTASKSAPSAALSVPVSDAALVSLPEAPLLSTSSVLEAAASQTILASVSGSSAIDMLPPDIQTVVVSEKDCRNEEIAVASGDGEQRTAGAAHTGAKDQEVS